MNTLPNLETWQNMLIALNSPMVQASNFIEGVQNPHIKNKLRSYQIINLKEKFGHAIHKDQKQNIRALDFGINSKPKSILHCSINVIKEKACFRCGSNSHFIKDCPLRMQDANVPHGKYTNHNTDTITNSTPDKVIEPLTRLFTDLIEQLRLLTPLGHNPHSGHSNYKGNGQYGPKWQHILLAIGNMVQLPTINTVMIIGTTKMTKDIILTTDRKVITGTTRSLQVITGNTLQSPTPEYMSHVANVILSVQLPLILRNTWMRKIFLHQTHQKLGCPSQDQNVVPENLRGSAFYEKVVRHPSSLLHTTNIGAETEIVHIGRKSHNECAVKTKIGNRCQKALWDSGAGRCVMSFDCYNNLHPRYRTELFPSNVRIRATNGSFIANKGECDLILKINDERFTFPFLCSDQLSQQMILGHNFSKAYCIGTLWNADDVMSLTKNGIPFAEMLPTNDINAIVFCMESTVIPPYSNGFVKCKMPKVKGRAYIGRSCVFEPSFRH